MSATPSKKKPANRTPASRTGWKPPGDGNRTLLVAVSLALFAGLPFVLGKYFELKTPDPFDSGSYVYSAQHVLSGARVGFEEKPSAQAGTLLVNMLGVELTGFNTETGSKLLQGLFQVAALTLMFLTIRRLYGSLAAVISVAVTSIYLSAPVIAKYGNVKEQFMIALMVLGICCFIWYRLTGKWWWALLTGVLLIGGPLFKQTGVSAIAALGLFLLAQPILHHYAWKKVGKDVLLLVAGALITLTPICAWYASMGTPLYYWPYSFVLSPVFKLAGADLKYVADTGEAGPSAPMAPTPEVHKSNDSLILRLLPGYVSNSWRMLDAAGRKAAFLRVLRYYRVLILPIALALGALVARALILLRRRRSSPQTPVEEDPGRFVLLLGWWWFFDMAFAWISPHSYEQYYLPLNASGAMLGSYLVGLYAHRLGTDRDGPRWVVLGLAGVLGLLILSWHIFFGLSWSPYSGTALVDDRTGQPVCDKGYLQKWREIAAHPRYSWKELCDYVRQNSQPTDPLYVWGWWPGIYVQAQRMSPTPKSFEGSMHILAPEQLRDRVLEIVAAFQKHPPKFIVDTRKLDFPLTRPALELWPTMWNGIRLLLNPTKSILPEDRKQWPSFMLRTLNLQRTDLILAAGPNGDPFLRSDLPETVSRHDAAYEKLLREYADADEALRYEAMQPLRAYVMKNYKVVGQFDVQVLFQHK